MKKNILAEIATLRAQISATRQLRNEYDNCGIGNKLRSERTAEENQLFDRLVAENEASATALHKAATDVAETLFAFTNRQIRHLNSCEPGCLPARCVEKMIKEAEEDLVPQVLILSENADYLKSIQDDRLTMEECWGES